MKTTTSVNTRIRLSTQTKIIIAASSFAIVLTILLFLFFNVFDRKKSFADTKPATGPDAPNAYFDATSNSYIDFGTANNLNCIKALPSGNTLTISLWVKWNKKTFPGVGLSANIFTLSDSIGSIDNGVFWIQHNPDNTKFEFALKTTSAKKITQSVTNPVEGTWYHIACVYDGSLSKNNMKLYINGTQESTVNQTGNISSFSQYARLNIGRWSNPQDGYRRFNGNIDNISIWNIALNAGKINKLMSDPTYITGTSFDASGLIGYWDFNNKTAQDLCSCGNNGFVASGVTLPVELMSFTGNIDNTQKVKLSWVTASETNNDFFTVEHSSDAENFTSLTKIKGAGTTNTTSKYSYIDVNPEKGINYYRIKQTDFDGKTTYLNTIAVNIEDKAGINMLKAGPNPFTDEINITFEASGNGKADLYILDGNGRLVRQTQTEVTTGTNFFNSTDNSGLAPGTYFICIIQNNKTSNMIKMIKSNQ